MYSREHGEKTYTFEPSGGLLYATLVMQDRETDTYWSILTDEAVHGADKGARLRQLPGSRKMTFGQWKALHPETKVLSVEGKEHVESSPYEKYFASDKGFRDLGATDKRLDDKTQIFGFHLSDKSYVVPHSVFSDGGAEIEVEGRKIFLYRLADDSHYQGTVALLLGKDYHLQKEDGAWVLGTPAGRTISFKVDRRSFGAPVSVARPIAGFDTFWYQWSLTNPGTVIIDPTAEAAGE